MLIEGEKKLKKVKKITSNIFLFLIANVIIFCTFGIAMVYYGPFTRTRDFIVTTAMTTFSHQYLATTFLSEKEINKIMEKYKVDVSGKSSDEKAIATFKPMTEEDKVELIDVSNGRYKGHMLIVSNPSRVVMGVAPSIGKYGMKLDELVKSQNAIGGINAGGFEDDNGSGNGGTPQGLLISNSEIVFGKENVKYDVIGFNNESKLILGQFTLKEIREKKIRDAATFEPFLIVNGETLIKYENSSPSLHPRTVIGQRQDGAVLMLVIDGRQLSSVGATLKEAQDIMLKHGAYNAANLDGGASTTMVYKGKIINSPCSRYGPRYLPSAFIIKDSEGSGIKVQ